MEQRGTWYKSTYSGRQGDCVEVLWRKSSYSGGQGGQCVEVGWHKSSYSDGRGGECVEVAEGPETLVRDTQNREDGHLTVPSAEWAALLRTTLRTAARA